MTPLKNVLEEVINKQLGKPENEETLASILENPNEEEIVVCSLQNMSFEELDLNKSLEDNRYRELLGPDGNFGEGQEVIYATIDVQPKE